MEPELWQRITDLFDEAMTRGPKERIAFLAGEPDRWRNSTNLAARGSRRSRVSRRT